VSLNALSEADLQAELAKVVCRLAATRGVLIAIDDAHWLDERSVQWLLRLGRPHSRLHMRLLMSIASRSPQAPLRPVEAILSEPGARVMSLAPLSSRAVHKLLEECLCDLGEDLDQSFAQQCYNATDGVPFLVVSLCRELVVGGVPPTAAAARHLAGITSQAVARSVRAGLSHLSPEAARVLEAVVVAGEPTPVEWIAAVTRLSLAKVGAAGRMLNAIGLLSFDAGTLRVAPLLGRTVYEEIGARRQSSLHLAWAKHLKVRGAPLEYVAEHLVAAELDDQAWVTNELLAAAHFMLRSGNFNQALSYLRRAFCGYPAAWDDPELLLDLVEAETPADPRAAVEHLRRCVELKATPKRTAALAHELACRLDEFDTFPTSSSPIRRSLISALQQIRPSLGEAETSDRIELAVAEALVDTTRPTSVGDLRRLGSVASPKSLADHKAAALLAVADTVSPRYASASEIADRLRSVLLDAYLCSEDPLDCQLWARALLSLARAGEPGLAERFARHAIAMSEPRGLAASQAEYSLTLAMSLTTRGEIVEACELAANALSLTAGRGWARRPDAAACLVAALVDQGRWDEAESLLSSFSGLVSETSPFEGPSLLEQRGRLRCCQGRSAEAIADLLAAGGRADEFGVDNPVVTAWRAQAAQLLAQQGRRAEAELLAQANLDLALAHGANWVVGPALRVVALVCESDKRLERLGEAVQLLRGSSAHLELATALVDLGRARMEAGEPQHMARSALRSALDIASRLNAAPLASRALTELRLSGARPRRAALSGPDSLTSGERRVVALAARGLTNSQIARDLFLADKTVEGHLVRSYRKLGVRSRRELKELLAAGSWKDLKRTKAMSYVQAGTMELSSPLGISQGSSQQTKH
jgi:DNA-binding CsgD family transcriptional regulator